MVVHASNPSSWKEDFKFKATLRVRPCLMNEDLRFFFFRAEKMIAGTFKFDFQWPPSPDPACICSVFVLAESVFSPHT